MGERVVAVASDAAPYRDGRTHLGVETQRQWAERAILRTTPTLLGRYSLVTMQAPAQLTSSAPVARQSAKVVPTFSDALALVRRELQTRTLSAACPTHPTSCGASP